MKDEHKNEGLADDPAIIKTPAIKTVANWEAKRSGLAITITGWEDGRRVTITGVADISADKDGPLATLKTESGQPPMQYRLT